MVKKAHRRPRREESLSREQIINASIEILDGSGESGLTFRTLAERLATGPGAIYWHIASKSDLLTAACDAIVAAAMDTPRAEATPQANVRALAQGLFDAMDAHPWVGAALTLAPAELPTVRILERIGRQIRALGVPNDQQWAAASALLSYIFGVSGQNAANTVIARERGLDRFKFLEAVSTAWLQLDPEDYSFARSMAGHLRAHDDRMDFLAGIDLILSGLELPLRNRRPCDR